MAKKHKKSSEIHLGFQIAPMIDVVFVIMLFFMVMAGMVKKENRQNIKLPGTEQTADAVAMPDEISIRIEDNGQILLNDDPVDNETIRTLPELTNNLAGLKANSDAAKTEVLVTIYANEQAKYERIMDCLDSLVRARISTVSFQAAAPE